MAGDAYPKMLRQAAHDAARAVLSAAPESDEGARALQRVIDWVGREHGADAVADLAFELALDFAEALDVLAAAQQADPLTLADRWFHDAPAPAGLDAPDDDAPG